MAKEQIKRGTRRKIEGRDHVWNGKKWIESMGFWRKQKTKTVGGKDYRLVDGKWVKSHGAAPRIGPALGGAIKGVMGIPTREQEAEIKKLREKRLAKKKAEQPKKRTKLKVTVPESAREGVKLDPKFTGGEKKKTSAKPKSSEKEAWLKKTKRSPAARSGSFTDDERWALQQKHRKWKSDRASGKLKKKKFDPRKGRNQRR